jgi:hypothetical protein
LNRLITLTYKYGRSTVAGFEGPWRLETYQPKDGSRALAERTMVESHADYSTRRNMATYGEGPGYDSRCSCCWLGITHSERKHAACIGQTPEEIRKL